jgi:fumarate reductase subunit D
MNQNPTDHAKPSGESLSAFHDLARRIIGILSMIIGFAMLVLVILIVAYVTSLFLAVDQPSIRETVTRPLEDSSLKLWDKVLPIGQTIITILAPILVLLLAIVAADKLLRGRERGVARITSDLPSVLALLIVATICLLPLAGVAVPNVLGKVALVVVGFYFGKQGRERKEDEPRRDGPNPSVGSQA